MYKFTLEKSITELRHRRKSTECTVRISSADLDPVFEPANRNTAKVTVAALTQSRMNTEPRQLGSVPRWTTALAVWRKCTNHSARIHLRFRDCGRRSLGALRHAGRDEMLLIKFIKSGLTPEDVTEVKMTRRIPLRILLDYIILIEFYIDRYTDEEIFLYYLDLFWKDRSGTRWTCSVGALKARRERLVKMGNLACR